MVAQRVHRRAGQTLPVPSWLSGILTGRAEVPIATATAEEARWWAVRLEPLTQEWGGQAYGGVQPLQTASTWARIRFSDGESSPMYVTWPVLGGVLHIFGQQLDVTALPLVSAMVLNADGPSWGVVIDDEPLSRTGRPDWVGLQLTPDGGSPLLPSDVLSYLLPPYARAVQVSQGPAIDPSAMAVSLAVETAGPTALSLGAVEVTGGGRVEIGPRAQILLVANNSAVAVDLSVFVEVAV